MAIWYWCWWVDLTKTATQWRIAHCLKQWGEILSIGWKLNMFCSLTDKTDKISAHVGFLICNLLFSTTILNSDMPKTNVLVIRYKENGWYVNAMCVSTRKEMQTLSVCLFVCLSVCLLVWSSATLVYMSLVHIREKKWCCISVFHPRLWKAVDHTRELGLSVVCKYRTQILDEQLTVFCWSVIIVIFGDKSGKFTKKINILEVKIWFATNMPKKHNT